MSKRSARWGATQQIDVAAGIGGTIVKPQFADLKVPCPAVVRVRVAAEQIGGNGDCAGCTVLVRVSTGVGTTELVRLLALAPVSGTPMETFLDTPAATVQCEASVVVGASVPPYSLKVTVLMAPWFGIPDGEAA